MNLVELRELLDTLGLDDNGKICILVGKTSDDEYEIVQVDSDGKMVVSGG
jgi:hypothetical protein